MSKKTSPVKVKPPRGSCFMWAFVRTSDARYFRLEPSEGDSDEPAHLQATTAELRDAVHVDDEDLATEMCDQLQRDFGEAWVTKRRVVSDADRWSYLARHKGVSIDQLKPDLQEEVLSMAAASRQINASLPAEDHPVNADEFAMMAFDIGCSMMDREQIATILGAEQDATWRDVLGFNDTILRAAIAGMRERYASIYLRRAQHFFELLASRESTPESRRVSMALAGCFPLPRCLAIGLCGEELLGRAEAIASQATSGGVETSVEFLLMMALLVGLEDESHQEGFSRWVAKKREVGSEFSAADPVAVFAAPVMRDGLDSLERWLSSSMPKDVDPARKFRIQ